MSRPVVVIPTYDEIENIGAVTEAVLELPERWHVLIVDDNSPDGTGEAAERLAKESARVEVIHRPRKEGIGPAYVEGFRRALDRGATLIAQMDADLSHDPADLPRLVAGLDDCDLAIGSRYRGGVRVLDWSVKRLALSLGASWYVKAILGLPVDDPTSGFKCFRAAALASLPLHLLTSRGYSFQVETTYRLWRMGYRIKEVRIVFQERRQGGSKITRGILYEALVVIWRIRFNAARVRWPNPARPTVEGQRDRLRRAP